MTVPFLRCAYLIAGMAGTSLAASLIGNQAMAAKTTPATTVAQEQSFADQVAALMAANPDGGDTLETELTKLALAQPEPAKAIAILMVALGSGPSSGKVEAVTRTIAKLGTYTPKELRDAINDYVSGAANPVAAAQGVLAVVSSLSNSDQQAVGYALGDVVVNLQKQDKTTEATVIQTEVTTSKLPALQKTFAESSGATSGVSGTNTNQGNQSPTNGADTPGSVPETPASSS